MPFLTDALIRRLKPDRTDYFLWDTEAAGFGVKVTPRGLRTFVLQWRSIRPPRQTRRRKIGRFGELDTDAARRAAASLKRNLQEGMTRSERSPKPARIVTVGDAVAAMIRERHRPAAPDHPPEDAPPRWLGMGLDKIRPPEVTALLDKLYGRDAIVALPTLEDLLGKSGSLALRVSTNDRTLGVAARTRHDKKAATASLIVNAATDVFLELGFDASLNKIADRAGVTKPTIYQHFADKKSLFRIAAYVIAEQCTAHYDFRANTDLFSTLLSFAKVYRYLLMRERNIAFYSLAVSSIRYMPELWAEIGQMTTGTVLFSLSHFLEEAMAHRRISPVNIYLAVENLLVSIGGLEHARLLLGHPHAPTLHTEDYVRSAIEIFVRGIGGSVPGSG